MATALQEAAHGSLAQLNQHWKRLGLASNFSWTKRSDLCTKL